MNLGKIEKELYGSKVAVKNKKKNFGSKKDFVPPSISQSTGEKQQEMEEDADKISSGKTNKWVRRILWFAGIFIAIVLGAGAFFLSQYNGGSRDVSIEILGAKEVRRGVIFEVDVNVNNKTDGILRNASLTINLSPGIIALNSLNDSGLIAEPVGDVGGGSLTKRTYKFLAIGEDKSVQNISANLSYVLGGGSSFETQGDKEVVIKNSVVEMEIKKPEQILIGSAFVLEVNYKNVSDFGLPEAVLEVKYPPSFKFVSSDIPPESLNNRWRLGELKAGSKGSLEIRGSLEDPDGASQNIPFVFYGNFLGKDYPIVLESVNLAIAPSPVSVDILLNRASDYTARIGDKLTYTIQYKNNSGIALADVVIKAALTGELFDFGTLQTNGILDRTAQSLIWNASNVSSLRLLDPGASGEANFEIKLKPQFPIQRLNDKNFYLKLNVQIDSPSVPYYLSASKTKALANLETKVAGLAAVEAKAFFRDASSGIVNAGMFPPKVGQPTDYTVHWAITNYATDIGSVEVRATLKPGVEWTGVVKSNVDTVPLLNESTGEIVWNIDKISATRGVLGNPVEAVFQIRATPAGNQIGQYQPLLNETNLTAKDNFTGLEMLSSDV
ncbi:MAG: hypothetical protein AAB935_00145, partial [Patescibacteria group bacterium]